jgi:murein DD-endopeptidase MepM/ murein hydrolase activator NlpD
LNNECCIIEEHLGATEEPDDYGDLLGAVAAQGCRPSGDAHLATLPSGRPAAPWLFPVPDGYVTDLYGWRIRPTTGKKQFHKGLDIGKGEGASIVAPADGRVTYINQNPSISSGRYLTIQHDDGWKSLYLHLLTPAVTQGARVRRGQRVGLMGKTGKLKDGRPAVTGAHLHWIVKDPCDNVVNPLVTLQGSFPKKRSAPVKGLYDSRGGVPWVPLALGAAGLYFLLSSRRRR